MSQYLENIRTVSDTKQGRKKTENKDKPKICSKKNHWNKANMEKVLSPIPPAGIMPLFGLLGYSPGLGEARALPYQKTAVSSLWQSAPDRVIPSMKIWDLSDNPVVPGALQVCSPSSTMFLPLQSQKQSYHHWCLIMVTEFFFIDIWNSRSLWFVKTGKGR